MRVSQHKFGDTQAAVYFLDAGETIPRHRHPFVHSTSVAAGKAQVKIWNGPLQTETLRIIEGDIGLPAGFDHEILALENGSIIINMSPISAVASCAAPGKTGGIMMADGTVSHDP